jgi:hypothetical protein
MKTPGVKAFSLAGRFKVKVARPSRSVRITSGSDMAGLLEAGPFSVVAI